MSSLFQLFPPDLIVELSYRIPFKSLKRLCDHVPEFNRICQDPNYWQLRSHILFSLTKQQYLDRYLEANFYLSKDDRNPPDDYLRAITYQEYSLVSYPEEGSEDILLGHIAIDAEDLGLRYTNTIRVLYDQHSHGVFSLALSALRNGNIDQYEYFMDQHENYLNSKNIRPWVWNESTGTRVQKLLLNVIYDIEGKVTTEALGRIMKRALWYTPRHVSSMIRRILETDNLDKYIWVIGNQDLNDISETLSFMDEITKILRYGSVKIGNYILDQLRKFNINVYFFDEIHMLDIKVSPQSIPLLKKIIRRLLDEKQVPSSMIGMFYIGILDYILGIDLPQGVITDFIESFSDLVNTSYSDEDNYIKILDLFDDRSLQIFTELNNAFRSIGINMEMINFRDAYESKIIDLGENPIDSHNTLKSISYLYINTKYYFDEELDLSKMGRVDRDLLEKYMDNNYFIPDVDWIHFL